MNTIGKLISDLYYSSFDDERGFKAYKGYDELLTLYNEVCSRGWL